MAVLGIARGLVGTLLAGPTSIAAPAAAGEGGAVGAAGSAAATTAAAAGPGGSAISSAMKEVINNISINLPVQALDLSSISDIQLKNLANRISRVIAEAAATGQFSLVGA
jgi:hypothetical protein